MRQRPYTAALLRQWLTERGYGEAQLPILNFGGAIRELADALDEIATAESERDALKAERDMQDASLRTRAKEIERLSRELTVCFAAIRWLAWPAGEATAEGYPYRMHGFTESGEPMMMSPDNHFRLVVQRAHEADEFGKRLP